MRFFFHYNRPATARHGKPMLSLHFRGKCCIVDNVDVRVRTYGRKRKQQPRFVMTGDATDITIGDDNVALIT